MKVTCPSHKIPVINDYDVVVVGAGVSGICSALASARSLAKTLLIERSGQLGGIATAGLMASLTNTFFDKNGNQIVNGIPYELVQTLVERGVVPAEWSNPAVPQIPHNSDEFQGMVYEKLITDKVDVLMMTALTDVVMGDEAVQYIICDNYTGKQAISASSFVDATGDASLAAMAGAPFEYFDGMVQNQGSVSNGGTVDRESGLGVEKQDLTKKWSEAPRLATLMFEMGNVDLDTTFDYFEKHPEDFNEKRDIFTGFSDFRENYLSRNIFHIPHGGGADIKPLQEAIKRGEYSKNKGLATGLDALGLFGLRGSKRVLVNSNFFSVDPINDMFSYSRALLEGKLRCLETAAILKKVMPGFEKTFITHIASELGMRITRTIQGRKEFQLNDLKLPVKQDDVIGSIPGWELGPNGKGIAGFSVELPLGMLLPKRVKNLIIGSGRSVSGRSAVRSALRGQAICMIVGQAAGVTAARASTTAKSGSGDIPALPIEEVQKALLEQNVYLGDNKRLKELGLL